MRHMLASYKQCSFSIMIRWYSMASVGQNTYSREKDEWKNKEIVGRWGKERDEEGGKRGKRRGCRHVARIVSLGGSFIMFGGSHILSTTILL